MFDLYQLVWASSPGESSTCQGLNFPKDSCVGFNSSFASKWAAVLVKSLSLRLQAEGLEMHHLSVAEQVDRWPANLELPEWSQSLKSFRDGLRNPLDDVCFDEFQYPFATLLIPAIDVIDNCIVSHRSNACFSVSLFGGVHNCLAIYRH